MIRRFIPTRLGSNGIGSSTSTSTSTSTNCSRTSNSSIRGSIYSYHRHNCSYKGNAYVNVHAKTCCNTTSRTMTFFSSMATQQTQNEHNPSYDHNNISSTSSSTKTATTKTATIANTKNSNSNKIKPFILTDIGEGITEVELIQWYIKPNDKIQQFDNVCQVQSDKATVDITSRYDGIVHSLNGCDVGDMIQVGQPLLFVQVDGVDDDDDDSNDNNEDHINNNDVVGDAIVRGGKDFGGSSSSSSSGSSNNDENVAKIDSSLNGMKELNLTKDVKSFQKRNQDNNGSMSTSTIPSPQKFLATPAVRKLIKEYDVDVSIMQGTGPNGRILKGDVLNVLGLNGGHTNIQNENDDESYDITQSEVESITFQKSSNSDSAPTINDDTVVPIRGYHRLMVNSMASTLQVPHMTYSDEVEMTNLMKMRHDLNAMLQEQKKSMSKVSFLPFMIKACSLAMKEYPILNSSIDVEEMNITYHARHDIGIAMDSDRGLVVPVVRGCENLSILEIASELDTLRELAINGGLTEKHLINPTFTLSNIGSIGGTIMSPVVLPPQVAIGAMGKIQRLPRFVNENSMEVAEYHIMNISWGGDHRVIDGATLGRFSNTWKSYIETPMKMAFSMK